MKIFTGSTVRNFGLRYVRIALTLGTVLVTTLASLGLFELAEKYNFGLARYTGGAVLAGGLFVGLFTMPCAIERMRRDEALYLREALAHEFCSYAMYASFLPLVGPHIARIIEKKKSKNPFLAKDVSVDR